MMYVYIYIYIYTYIHTYTYVYIYIYIYVNLHITQYMHVEKYANGPDKKRKKTKIMSDLTRGD